MMYYFPASNVCKIRRKIEKPKRFNWFYKELGYMRPGSIEILVVSKLKPESYNPV